MDLPYLIGFLILLIWNSYLAFRLEQIKNAHNNTIDALRNYTDDLSKVINNIIDHVNDIEDFLEGAEVEEEGKED